MIAEDSTNFREVRLMRFFHTPTEIIYNVVANLSLLDESITCEPPEYLEEYFNPDNLITLPLAEGKLDLASFYQDQNDTMIFHNDIVAIYFADKANGNAKEEFTPQKPSDYVKDPRKRFNYFISPVNFAAGLFYLTHPGLNYTMPLSSIPRVYLEVIGNVHKDACLLPEETKKKQQP